MERAEYHRHSRARMAETAKDASRHGAPDAPECMQSLALVLVHIIFSTKNPMPFLQSAELRSEVHAYEIRFEERYVWD